MKRPPRPGERPAVKAGAGMRMGVICGVALAVYAAAFVMAQKEIAVLSSDKAIILPKVKALAAEDHSHVGLSFYQGFFTAKRTEITLTDLNAMWVKDMPAAPDGTPTSLYFLPQGDKLIGVMSLPLEELGLPGKHFNPTFLLEQKLVEGEKKPLLKVSKIQINKQDLSKEQMHRFNNLVNLAYGIVGLGGRMISSRSNGVIPPPSDAVTGDVLDAIRVRYHESLLEFNPSDVEF